MRNKVKLSISEVVASMLLLLIVVSIGTALYLYLYYKSTFYQQRISQELLAEEIRLKQQLAILLVHGYSSTRSISIVVATGSFPVEVNAIYVNDTLAYETTLNLDKYAVEEISITSPITLNSGDIVYVKIVYAGGYFYVEASGEVT
ncbi:MAG: hypothetical protein DRO23_10620 [Thermoprotei archaeon]|nr:MAG: hypothetical protein DRO23_10620 [Thermoprotei archaeon]